MQAPVAQLVAPLGLMHAVPQLPQSVPVVRLVSQPLSALKSQSAQPPLQVIAHTPLKHDAAPCTMLHCLPHAPQFAMLVSRGASQPLPITESQSANPSLQEKEHLPAVHAVEELG